MLVYIATIMWSITWSKSNVLITITLLSRSFGSPSVVLGVFSSLVLKLPLIFFLLVRGKKDSDFTPFLKKNSKERDWTVADIQSKHIYFILVTHGKTFRAVVHYTQIQSFVTCLDPCLLWLLQLNVSQTNNNNLHSVPHTRCQILLRLVHMCVLMGFMGRQTLSLPHSWLTYLMQWFSDYRFFSRVMHVKM